MARICPSCGYASADNRGFCTQCGTSLPASPSLDRTFLEVNYQNIPENELRFVALARDLPEAVILVDRDLRFSYANKGVYNIIGISPTHCRGKTATETGLPEYIAGHWDDAFRAVFTSGEPCDLRFRHPKDGDLIILNLSPVPGPGYTVDQVLAVSERTYSIREEGLGRAISRLQRILSVTRHDIANGTMQIQGYMELLKTTTDPAKREDYLRKIKKCLERLYEVGELPARHQDLLGIELGWRDVTDILSRIQVPTGITLEIVQPLPEVVADIKLEKALGYLIEYAAWCGGDVTRVRISAMETTEGCVIQVEDNGAGVPQEKKHQLFNENRYAADKETSLYSVWAILSITGINIRETGTPGKGTRFEIIVPKGSYRVARPRTLYGIVSGEDASVAHEPSGQDLVVPADHARGLSENKMQNVYCFSPLLASEEIRKIEDSYYKDIMKWMGKLQNALQTLDPDSDPQNQRPAIKAVISSAGGIIELLCWLQHHRRGGPRSWPEEWVRISPPKKSDRAGYESAGRNPNDPIDREPTLADIRAWFDFPLDPRRETDMTRKFYAYVYRAIKKEISSIIKEFSRLWKPDPATWKQIVSNCRISAANALELKEFERMKQTEAKDRW